MSSPGTPNKGDGSGLERGAVYEADGVLLSRTEVVELATKS